MPEIEDAALLRIFGEDPEPEATVHPWDFVMGVGAGRTAFCDALATGLMGTVHGYRELSRALSRRTDEQLERIAAVLRNPEQNPNERIPSVYYDPEPTIAANLRNMIVHEEVHRRIQDDRRSQIMAEIAAPIDLDPISFEPAPQEIQDLVDPLDDQEDRQYHDPLEGYVEGARVWTTHRLTMGDQELEQGMLGTIARIGWPGARQSVIIEVTLNGWTPGRGRKSFHFRENTHNLVENWTLVPQVRMGINGKPLPPKKPAPPPKTAWQRLIEDE